MKPIALPHAPATSPSVRQSLPPTPFNAFQPRSNVFCRIEPPSSLRRPEGATISLAG